MLMMEMMSGSCCCGDGAGGQDKVAGWDGGGAGAGAQVDHRVLRTSPPSE